MYEYKVIAAPTRGVKAKGVRSAEGRFSNALEKTMNEMAADGWEYQRAETLPSVERSGLTSTTTTWRNVLVFRRIRPEPEAAVDDITDEEAVVSHDDDIDPEDIPPVLRDEVEGLESEDVSIPDDVDVEEKLRDQAWKDRDIP